MTDDEMQQLRLRMEAGMRAMSAKEMMQREMAQAEGMRQRGPLTSGEQEAMRNFWGATADAQNNIITDAPPTTLWARFRRWIRA